MRGAAALVTVSRSSPSPSWMVNSGHAQATTVLLRALQPWDARVERGPTGGAVIPAVSWIT
jgi:hypothetical protein